MTTPLPIDHDKAQAESDLNDIFALRKNLPFNRYFMREAQEAINRLEQELTDAERPDKKKDRHKKLGELKVWRRIAKKLDQDEVGKRSILGLMSEERPLEGEE